MGVDGGAGNAISFSEIQTFYGGTNPISLSEYYRGGSEVPGEQVTAQSDTSGTADQTIGEFGVDVTTTSTFTGSLQNQSNSASVSIQSDTAKVEITNIHPDADGGSSNRTVTVFRNGVSIGSFATNDGAGNGAAILACTIAGPANNGAVSSPNGGTFSSGTITFSGSSSTMREVTRAQVTTHDVDFTNNGSVTITTTSGSTGGAQSYTAGQTRKVKDDQSTSNYVLGYDAVTGNTNVPASGTINLDVFNAPGTPTP